MLSRSKVTKKRLNEMRAFLKDFNVGMDIVPYGSDSFADIPSQRVSIERDNLVNMWSTIFHELCHIICEREGKFPAYHSMSYHKNLTKQHKMAIRRTGYRAELYVDKMAERMFNCYFPDLEYNKSYRTWVHKTWHQAWLESRFTW